MNPPQGPFQGYGPRHGHVPHPHPGYGHGYPGAPYPEPPRPPKSSNVLIIVIAVLAGALIVGGGSCLLCVGLAAVASDADDGGQAPTPSSPVTETPAPTPVARKLETALEANGVPVRSVLCPRDVPSRGSFTCQLETLHGDRAAIVVTVGDDGMAYDVPDTAFLDGAKLEATFRGIVARVNPRLQAPCLTGTLMKPVGADFTCPVFDRGNEAGTLTVQVLNKSGEVKMTYDRPASAAGAASTANARTPSGGDTTGLDGRYACFQMRIVMGPSFTSTTQWVPGALPGFTIAGGRYETASGPGSVSVAGTVVTFTGGGYAGWRGVIGTNSTGQFIRFRGKEPGNPRPNEGAKNGDYQCYRQR